jgi:hypothetical protein
VDQKKLSEALSAAWRALPEEEKQTWHAKNAEVKKTFDEYKSRGGIVTPGAYAKLKERKAQLHGADGGAGKGSRKRQSTKATADLLATCSTDALLKEIRRRLCKQPRLEESDNAPVSAAEASTTVPPTDSSQTPDPADLLQRFGKKVPQEQHAGMLVWMRKRLQKTCIELTLGAGSPPSDKELWKVAKLKWMELDKEKKDRYASSDS